MEGNEMPEIKELIEIIVGSIVDNVDNVKIYEEITDDGILYEITVSKEDVGKLIGKKGRVASALRTIAKASGAKNGVRVIINVMNKPL
jgi:predicted RNA-binding protein YlqC (UPF0109 family)